jgi:hypothetical protein
MIAENSIDRLRLSALSHDARANGLHGSRSGFLPRRKAALENARDSCARARLQIAFAAISRKPQACLGANRMTLIFRVLAGLAGVAGLIAAVAFWIHPDAAAQGLGLTIANATGTATVRADMAGFFGASGVFALLAAVRSDARYAFVVLVLMLFALGGRLINVVLSGYAPALLPPMVIELVVIALFAATTRVLGKAA